MAVTEEPQVFVVLMDQADLLDLGGPVQVFRAAGAFGARYLVRFVGDTEAPIGSSAGLSLCQFERLQDVEPTSKDIVFIPGTERQCFANLATMRLINWLARASKRGTTIFSSCTGAFVLAEAGLLDRRHSTTHWTRINDLRIAAPKSFVESDVLFVQDGNVYTGGGVTSGIDLALYILETRHGPLLATNVARELIVYLRRDGQHPQNSVYLDYRNHVRAGVHRVQDWIIQNPSRRATLPELAKIAGLSPRHLSRVFRAATGVTIGRYTTLLRLERARSLSSNPELTQSAVADECGYQDSRQLRRIRRANRLSGLKVV